MIGIYKITNLINQKVYIGQSVDIEKRWKTHKTHSLDYYGEDFNCVFYKAIRKYGLENFSFEVIEECSKEELDEKEKYWIKFYNSFLGFENCNGYNMTLGGNNSSSKVLTYSQAKEIQNLLLNTRISQEEIGKLFNIHQGTVSYINRGLIWKEENLSYPLRSKKFQKEEKTKNYCIDCGKLIDRQSIRCEECYHKSLRLVERSEKEDLKKLLIENKGNFSKVSRLFGITDNALRKWCKTYGMPYHSSDYK